MFYRGIFLSRCLSYKYGCSTVWRTNTKQVLVTLLLSRHFHLKSNYCFATFDDKTIRTKFEPLGKHGEVILKKLEPQSKGISVITISNPERKNAMTGSMMVQLAEIVDQLETWNEGRAVILHGNHGTFCSGADLTFARSIVTSEQGKEMCSLMHYTLRRFAKLPMISVAAIEGRALGGGAEIPLACDFRLMRESAEMRFVQAKMGVSPGWGGGVKLVQLVGRKKALQLLLKAESIDVNSALEYGLVDGKLEEGMDVIDGCTKWLSDYLQNEKTVIRSMKGVVSASDDLLLDKALEIERSIFATVWGAEANKKALNQQKKHR